MNTDFNSLESIQGYYGKVLQSNADLQTSACCTAESMPAYLRPHLREVHEEVQEKFYGCGSPIPHELNGRTVLDLGSGSGRDCYLMSKLVGESGQVIGVDMTDEQLSVARKHVNYHTKLYGYNKPNVEFRQGYIEDLESVGVASNSVDIVTSNCVLNLSPNKERVFSEIFRVLKPGGELYFSDVFAGSRIPEALRFDDVLLGECLSGAMYIQDFRRLLAKLNCSDYRVVSQATLEINSPEIEKKIGMIDFYSMTIRAFKLSLEDRCEDYGQVAYYLGTLPESRHEFMLDDHHLFKTGKPYPVCSNTAAMLTETRFARHFNIVGNTNTHYGLFDCDSKTTSTSTPPGACC